jgi:hypothetical protein
VGNKCERKPTKQHAHITQHISAVRLYTAAAYYLCGDSGRQLLEYNKLLTHQQQLSDFYFLFFFLFFNLHAGAASLWVDR